MAGDAGALSLAIKVAALCGSLRKGSFHRGLIRSAIELSKGDIKGMEIEYIDISTLPMLNTDLESNRTYPPEVEALRQKILVADSVLFASSIITLSQVCDRISKPSLSFSSPASSPASSPSKAVAAPAPTTKPPASSPPAAAPVSSTPAPVPVSSPPAPVPVSSPPAKSPPAPAPTTPPKSAHPAPVAAPTAERQKYKSSFNLHHVSM